ncbi:MAG: hypothetical protein PHN31_00525 [Candidatus Gracilibacteria bacterium]|nr:hypothetical protein [Candidatus Gracilibacteria bacterium]
MEKNHNYLSVGLLITGNNELEIKIKKMIEVICGKVDDVIDYNGNLEVTRIMKKCEDLGLLNSDNNIDCGLLEEKFSDSLITFDDSIDNHFANDGFTPTQNFNYLRKVIVGNIRIYGALKKSETFDECDKYIYGLTFKMHFTTRLLNLILSKCKNSEECDLAIKKYGKGVKQNSFTETILNGKKGDNNIKPFVPRNRYLSNIEKSTPNQENATLFDKLSAKYNRILSVEQIRELEVMITKDGLSEEFALDLLQGRYKKAAGTQIRNKSGSNFSGKR